MCIFNCCFPKPSKIIKSPLLPTRQVGIIPGGPPISPQIAVRLPPPTLPSPSLSPAASSPATPPIPVPQQTRLFDGRVVVVAPATSSVSPSVSDHIPLGGAATNSTPLAQQAASVSSVSTVALKESRYTPRFYF